LKTEIIGIQAQSSHNGNLNGGHGNDFRVNNDMATASRKGADTTQIYSRVVERYAMFFDRPEARLRFLNNTLTKQADRQDRLQRRFGRFRLFERTRIYDWVLEARCYSAIFEEMRAMYSSLPKDRRKLAQRIQAPFSARLLFLIRQSRHAFYGTAVILTLFALAGLYTFGAWSARGVNAYLANKYNRPSAPAPALSQPTGSIIDVLSNTKPEKAWLIGTEGEYEKWSNGCSISTRYVTDNHPRSYYTIPRGSESNGDRVSSEIVGIVYHTPESNMVDFTPDNNKAIQKGSRGLLEYVRDHKKYNYVINRIGDIYRIVRDDHAAYHAGDSLWADEKNTYVLLNESFLGVCFESKFEGASSLNEILTEAQIISGRRLTDVLRSKHKIDDTNCTTHGLVAVDPEKMLIARHHDWVRFFPFEAMGLSNKYKMQPPNMTDYGFTYDEDVLAKLGHKLWEGAVTAEEEFNRRAGLARVSPDDLRRKLRDRYVSQRNKTLGLHAEQGDANNPRLAKKPSGADESTEPVDSQSTSAAWKAAN
jgi:N-acetyl-anhydromuramyl-L-alanine amidase AmpD